MSTYALVRDKDGNPRFDDYNNIAAGFWAMLTEDEQKSIIVFQKGGELIWL
ncbi:MAG: hypothetical protein JKY52_09845 [Flavobacteriales bacterium]|nr:hypothetical protein [Flavobacteriales bacterium]